MNSSPQDRPPPGLSPAIEATLARLLLAAAIVFALTLLWPSMHHGYSSGGDDVVHMAYNYEAQTIVDSEHKLFGWSYLFGFGAPIFLFRPPLQYALVAFAHQALLGHVSLSAIHKFTYVLFLALYPFSIYYLLRKLRFRPLIAATGALFAITPISMWGHTIDAYFRLGIAKQLIAIFLFPIALGKLHGTVANREPVLPAALLIALCFLSHPYMPYCLLLVCGVYSVIALLGAGWKSTLALGWRFGLTWLLTGGLLAFYLVPFYTSPEIQALDFSSTWRHAFEVVCSTTAKTLNHFFTGGLFDTTRWGVYGGGEWGWQSNNATGRWPVLTALCIAGILVCVRRRRDFAFAFLLSAFTLSFLMFLGPDDLPLLDLLPFQSNFQYIHEVFMLDCLAICLAGIGGGTLLAAAADWIAGRVPASANTSRFRNVIAAVVVMAFAAALVYSPWRDRWLVGDRIVTTKGFDTRGDRLTARSLRVPVNASFQPMLDILRNPAYPGRFYGSAQGDASGMELFYFTILPALCQRTDVICGFFSAEVAGVNKTVIEQFRPDIPKHRNLIELFNVRYLIAAAANRDALAPASDYADLIAENPYWLLWRTRGTYDHFDIIHTRPIAVYADIPVWREFCHDWLKAYQVTPAPGRFPYFVRLGDSASPIAALDPHAYAAVIVAGPDTQPTRDSVQTLRAYEETGGRVITEASVPGLATERLLRLSDLDFGSLAADPIYGGECAETSAARENHAAHVSLPEASLVLFKMAYYQSWMPIVDGKPVPMLEISPGFPAIPVPAGTHDISFRYDGPNNWRRGAIISICSLLIGVSLYFICRLFCRPPHPSPLPQGERESAASMQHSSLSEPSPPAGEGWVRGILRDWFSSPTRLDQIRPLGITAIWLVVLVSLTTLYVREQFLRIPIPIRPAKNSMMETDVLLDWNALDATGVTYEVQIADTGPKCTHLVYARGELAEIYARKERGLAPDRQYWWRVRSSINGHNSAWCHPVPFRTFPAPGKSASTPWTIDLTCVTNYPAAWPIAGHSSLPEGSYIQLRLYRDDTRVRVQSTAVRLIQGRFNGALVPPAGGWPSNVTFTLHADCVLEDQTYPVTTELGLRGEQLAARTLDPDHLLLWGLQADTDVLRVAANAPPPTALPVPAPAVAGWAVKLAANLDAEGRLRVEGNSNLPENALFTVTITAANQVDPVARQTGTLANGNMRLIFQVDPSQKYTATAVCSIDRQYESVRAILGQSGEDLHSRSTSGNLVPTGLRRVLPLSTDR